MNYLLINDRVSIWCINIARALFSYNKVRNFQFYYFDSVAIEIKLALTFDLRQFWYIK